MKTVYPLIALFLFACGRKERTSDSQPNEDTSRYDARVLPKNTPSNPRSDSAIYGIWRMTNDENATFEITRDSIFYFDQDQTYKYHLSGDSISVFYSDFQYRGRFEIVRDTLSFSDENGVTKYVRQK